MQLFCQDKHILAVEPGAYLSAGQPARQLAAGTDGQLSDTTFTSVSADFNDAQVAAGMVLTVHRGVPSEGVALEVVSVDSATTLTVSVLRLGEDDPAIAPAAGTGLSWFVQSLGPQIADVSAQLAEKLRQLNEAAGVQSATFADSAQLRLTTAYGVLAAVYATRSSGPDARDANAFKARYYREQFARQQLQLRLAVDADGDGLAEQTRTLGHVRMRRV